MLHKSTLDFLFGVLFGALGTCLVYVIGDAIRERWQRRTAELRRQQDVDELRYLGMQ